MDTQKAIFTRLIGDSQFLALMDTYGGQPAVFSDRFPPDFTLGEKPACIISLPKTNQGDDASDDYNNDVLSPVRFYHKPNGSSAALVGAAWRAVTLFRNWPPEVIDGLNYQVESVAGPENAPAEDPDVQGALVHVRQYIGEP